MNNHSNIYDPHVISTLTQFYLDPGCMKVYHGRWDTYLATKGLWEEYFYLMFKTDDQVARIIAKAKEQASSVSSSPLSKAMQEND